VDDTNPRPITSDLIREFVEWTHKAPMFLSSPQGAAFATELRAVFLIALEAQAMNCGA
jgi:hypothetical protein